MPCAWIHGMLSGMMSSRRVVLMCFLPDTPVSVPDMQVRSHFA